MPVIVKPWVSKLTEPLVPFEPVILKVEANPVNPEPSPAKEPVKEPVKADWAPLNEPVKEPVKAELAPVNWREEAPDTTVPLSVKEELVNAAPLHLVTALVFKAEAPETATVAGADPSYAKAVIPVPCVKSGRFVERVPKNEPLNEPVNMELAPVEVIELAPTFNTLPDKVRPLFCSAPPVPADTKLLEVSTEDVI